MDKFIIMNVRDATQKKPSKNNPYFFSHFSLLVYEKNQAYQKMINFLNLNLNFVNFHLS